MGSKAIPDMVRSNSHVTTALDLTLYYPFGDHLFSILPWSHLLFTRPALIRWRSDFKIDGAGRFAEVEGGLNHLTVRWFERFVDRSPCRFAKFEAVPTHSLRLAANRLT
jgi:hypothetical protein